MDSESSDMKFFKEIFGYAPKGKTILYAGYQWGWCNHCDCIFSVCRICGNNSCNPAPIDRGCAGCEDNYDLSSYIYQHPDEVEFIKERLKAAGA